MTFSSAWIGSTLYYWEYGADTSGGSQADVGPERAGDRLVLINFSSYEKRCNPQTLQLHKNDFHPAAPEIHEQVK